MRPSKRHPDTRVSPCGQTSGTRTNVAHTHSRGFIIVAALIVLTLLVTLATFFFTRAHLEYRAAEYVDRGIQAELAAQSACADFLSAVADRTVYGSRHERLWSRVGRPVSDAHAREFSGLLARPGKWTPLRDARGRLVARYTFQVEDETGKLNLNVSGCYRSPSGQPALSPADLALDTSGRAGPALNARLLAELRRDIRARVPADVDTQRTGIDRLCPLYSAVYLDPVEWNTCLRSANWRELARWATVYPAGSPREQRVNLNVSNVRAVRRAMKQANRQFSFERSGRALDQIAANIVDSRDENHVMTTLNNAYGVESVVINEILSHNDERWLDARGYNPLGPGGAGIVRAGEWYENLSPRFPRHVSPSHLCSIEEFDASQKRVRLARDTHDAALFGLLSRQEGADARGLPDVSMADLARAMGTAEDTTAHGALNWHNGLFAGRTLWLAQSPAFSNALSCKVTASEGDWLWLDTWHSAFPVDASAENNEPCSAAPFASGADWYAAFATIATSNGCEFTGKGQSDVWYIFGLAPGQYYCVDIHDFAGPSAPAASDTIDVDGNLARVSSSTSRDGKTPYRNGSPVPARQVEGCEGVIAIPLTGRPRGRRPSRVSFLHVYGPEAIELYNCGPSAVSIRNWSLVVDCGGALHTLHTFSDVVRYSVEMQMQTHDSNPVVEEDSYLYLVNNARIFDFAFGNMRDGIWGDDSGEQMPLARASADDWGVPYTLGSVNPADVAFDVPFRNVVVGCRGARWRSGGMRGELMRNRTARSYGKGQNVRGTVFAIADNTKSTATLRFRPSDVGIPWRRGDRVHVVGLPLAGIDGTMTLRNSYGQICARAANVPASTRNRPLSSIARTDPALDEWKKRRKASFGGIPRRCHNPTHARMSADPVVIRNCWFASPIGALTVRTILPWHNVDSGGARRAYVKRWTQAALHAFTVPALWLPVERARSDDGGWSRAFGRAAHEGMTTLADEHAQWESGMWVGHKLTVRTGARKGQSYPITKSTENSVTVVGLSVPGRVPFRVKAGDAYCVGPGHSIGYFYSRADGAEHQWEWQDPRLTPGEYGLTLMSVNDSIDSSSVLEENRNAELTIAAWNFVDGKFDVLKENARCDKTDLVRAGALGPPHISNGTVRLQVRATGLNAPKCSGMAWFGGVSLTPVDVQGKININAAAPRLLRIIPGVGDAQAEAILAGRTTDGGIAPWESLSEVASIINWPLASLAAGVNVMRVTAGALRLTCVGEMVIDADGDGRWSPESGDKIRARKVLAFLLVSDEQLPQRWTVKPVPPIPQNLVWEQRGRR